MDGPPDLAADRAIEQSVCGEAAVTKFVGGTPEEFPNRYREGSASELLPIGIPQELLLAGKAGEVWSGLFKQYVAAAEKAGDPVHLTTIEGGHFDGLNPQATAWATVMIRIRSLLDLP